jgi:gliding motility-associated lipoprotein GldD
MKQFLIGLILTSGLWAACEGYVPTPRPYAYPRIELPAPTQRSYETLRSASCPVTLEYPAQGQITRDLGDSCWVDITFDEYDLTWHLTVRDIEPGPQGISPYLEDHRRLVYKHSQKGRIEEEFFESARGDGFWFDITGQVGTPTQVFMTDPSDRYSLVLSFYYNTATARDSLRPITDYMRQEMRHTLESLRWQ